MPWIRNAREAAQAIDATEEDGEGSGGIYASLRSDAAMKCQSWFRGACRLWKWKMPLIQSALLHSFLELWG